VQGAYHLGVNSYIVKPVEFEKFMEVSEKVDLYWTVVNKRSY
jgi:response regulator of citrate/malate metabolism